MRCEICARDSGAEVEAVALKINRDEPGVALVAVEQRPRVACPECAFLLFMPAPETPFEAQLETWTRRQWAAHRNGLPFMEEPPKSPAELACERFARQCAALEVPID